MELEKYKNIIVTIGKYRDGFLVISALTYLNGLIAFSYHNWKNQIGPLPALDFQYFVVGIPISLFIIIASLLILAFRCFLKNTWPNWLANQTQSNIKLILVILICSLIVLSIFVIRTLLSLIEQNILTIGFNSLLSILFVFDVLLLAYSRSDSILITKSRLLLFLVTSSGVNKNFLKIYKTLLSFCVYSMVGIFTLLFVLFFISNIYTQIPQALGGAKSREARIDIITTELSEETLLNLGVVDQTRKVAQTRSLNVYFIGSNQIIVGTQIDNSDSSKIIFEISRSAIKAINWIK